MTLSRHQLEHVDLITEIEQNPTGRNRWNGRVATALFRENTRGMDTLGNLLTIRHDSQRDKVRFWEKRNAYVPVTEVTTAGPNPHDGDCPCDGCIGWTKRLLRAVDLLPRGVPHYFDFISDYKPAGSKVPVRYRRDESDR